MPAGLSLLIKIMLGYEISLIKGLVINSTQLLKTSKTWETIEHSRDPGTQCIESMCLGEV